MTGIKSGSRLEQLEQLARKIALEIAAERRRLALDPPGPGRPPARPDSRHLADLSTHERLRELGVTSKTVKEWAVKAGHLTAVRQGRVARWVVEAYAEHITTPRPPIQVDP